MYHDYRGHRDAASPFEYCKLPQYHTVESYGAHIRKFEKSTKVSLLFVCDMDIAREITGLSVDNLQLNSTDTVLANKIDSKSQYIITSDGEEWFNRLSFYECQLIIAATLFYSPLFLTRLFEIAKHRAGNIGMTKHIDVTALFLKTQRLHHRQVIDNPNR